MVDIQSNLERLADLSAQLRQDVELRKAQRRDNSTPSLFGDSHAPLVEKQVQVHPKGRQPFMRRQMVSAAAPTKMTGCDANMRQQLSKHGPYDDSAHRTITQLGDHDRHRAGREIMKIEVLRTKAMVPATYEQAEIIRSHENITCDAPSTSQITKRMTMWDAESVIKAAEAGEQVEIHFC